MNQEPVAPEGSGRQDRRALKFKNQKVVFFKIDDDAPYGEVVHFMDIVRGAGATTLGIVNEGLGSSQNRDEPPKRQSRQESWGQPRKLGALLALLAFWRLILSNPLSAGPRKRALMPICRRTGRWWRNTERW